MNRYLLVGRRQVSGSEGEAGLYLDLLADARGDQHFNLAYLGWDDVRRRLKASEHYIKLSPSQWERLIAAAAELIAAAKPGAGGKP